MTNLKAVERLLDQVEHCLERYHDCRNSDLTLFEAVLTTYYEPIQANIQNTTQFVNILRNYPPYDHITRARRKVIQSHGYTKYLPTIEDIAKERRINAEKWSAYMQHLGSPVFYKSDPQVLMFEEYELKEPNVQTAKYPSRAADENKKSNCHGFGILNNRCSYCWKEQ